MQEIERPADHPKMVQVMLCIGPTDFPLGEPIYHPTYEAAARHNLVVGIHRSENSRTALGFHRYFIDGTRCVSQVFMSEVVSLVFNEVFDKNPELKVFMIEGDFSYVPHLMWKMDQQYRGLRAEVPWVKLMPSDIVREQVRFAAQPVEELSWEQLSQIIDQMGSDELLCSSTDYPHWDFDSLLESLPTDMLNNLKRKIFSENAWATYQRLPSKTPAVA